MGHFCRTFSPLLWLQALWTKKLLLGKKKTKPKTTNCPQCIRCQREMFSGYINRVDSVSKPTSHGPAGLFIYFATPCITVKVPSSFSAHTQPYACTHTPYWKLQLLVRLPSFSRIILNLPETLAEMILTWFVWKLHPLDWSPWQQLISAYFLLLFSQKETEFIHHFHCSCSAPR